MTALPAGQMAVVLDDEAAARDAAAAVLRECGVASVVATAHGHHALELVATGHVALIVCDLAMPHMDGVQFIERLAALAPRTPLVLASGTNDKVLKLVEGLARELELNLVGAFKKPILAPEVRRVLARPGIAPEGGRVALAIEAVELREALARGQFEVYYQPIVQLAGGNLLSVEALMRWNHPLHGILGADHFIPLAERSGLVFSLTQRIAADAIAQLGIWNRAGPAGGLPPSVSLNISPHGVGPPGFPDDLAASVIAEGLRPEQVTLELTETAIAESAEITRFVSRVRLRGFQLAIDDFGTGHSGLGQLHRLPFTSLKIDKTFVSGATQDREARAIVEAGVRLGRELGLKTVAEGVEALEEWAALDALGCDAAQGYWISPPIPAHQIPDWVERWRRVRRY